MDTRSTEPDSGTNIIQTLDNLILESNNQLVRRASHHYLVGKLIADKPIWMYAMKAATNSSWKVLNNVSMKSGRKMQLWTKLIFVNLRSGSRLPWNLLSPTNVVKIGNLFGEVLGVDEVSIARLMERQFLIICMLINVRSSLIKSYWVLIGGNSSIEVQVKYEQLPNFCFKCGLFGHFQTKCAIDTIPSFSFGLKATNLSDKRAPFVPVFEIVKEAKRILSNNGVIEQNLGLEDDSHAERDSRVGHIGNFTGATSSEMPYFGSRFRCYC
ncbi:hypothetical protein Ancab_022850 [Ancistrocladus abbreviatus]